MRGGEGERGRDRVVTRSYRGTEAWVRPAEYRRQDFELGQTFHRQRQSADQRIEGAKASNGGGNREPQCKPIATCEPRNLFKGAGAPILPSKHADPGCYGQQVHKHDQELRPEHPSDVGFVRILHRAGDGASIVPPAVGLSL